MDIERATNVLAQAILEWRGRRARRQRQLSAASTARLRLENQAAELVQRVWRRILAKKVKLLETHCSIVIAAVLTIQAFWRGKMARREFKLRKSINNQFAQITNDSMFLYSGGSFVFINIDLFVIMIQRCCRAFGCRKKLWEELERQRAARAQRIRAPSFVPIGYRFPSSKDEAAKRKSALRRRVEERCAKVVQRWWRAIFWARRQALHVLRMRRLVVLNGKATLIQRWWRALQRRRWFSLTAHKADVESSAMKLVEFNERIATRQLQHGELLGVWKDITRQRAPKALPPLASRGASLSLASLRPKTTYMERERFEVPAGRYALNGDNKVLKMGGWNFVTATKDPSWLCYPKDYVPPPARRLPLASSQKPMTPASLNL